MCHYLITLDETAWVRICHYIDLLCYSFIANLVHPLATAPVWVESVLATIFAIFWIVIRVLCDDRHVGSLTISSNILIASCESNSVRDGNASILIHVFGSVTLYSGVLFAKASMISGREPNVWRLRIHQLDEGSIKLTSDEDIVAGTPVVGSANPQVENQC
jgi:hypothetical protein